MASAWPAGRVSFDQVDDHPAQVGAVSLASRRVEGPLRDRRIRSHGAVTAGGNCRRRSTFRPRRTGGASPRAARTTTTPCVRRPSRSPPRPQRPRSSGHGWQPARRTRRSSGSAPPPLSGSHPRRPSRVGSLRSSGLPSSPLLPTRDLSLGLRRPAAGSSPSPPPETRKSGSIRANGGQTGSGVSGAYMLVRHHIQERPQQDSNLRTRLRRPMLYPLSYGGWVGGVGSKP